MNLINLRALPRVEQSLTSTGDTVYDGGLKDKYLKSYGAGNWCTTN
jgi:hypothetical protein